MTDDTPDEFPSEAELPDDPLAVDDIDPFTVDDSDFSTLDGFARAEWVETTSARERVRTVVKYLDDDADVDEIADTALVSVPETESILDSINNLDED